ncbi:hypothetical protein BH11PSE13_BH11PSE13_31900 [soil metagenome]
MQAYSESLIRTFRNRLLKSIFSAFVSIAALCLAAGCASGNTSQGSSAATSASGGGGSGIQVFGVIDAGVSHTTSKSTPSR